MDESTGKELYEKLKFHTGHNVLLTNYPEKWGWSWTTRGSIGLECESCDQEITYWNENDLGSPAG
jgi:hypothetical protein